jgi:hypothetical protein
MKFSGMIGIELEDGRTLELDLKSGEGFKSLWGSLSVAGGPALGNLVILTTIGVDMLRVKIDELLENTDAKE